MSWNYRVIARPTPQNEWTFGIHEVYYNELGEPDMWSEDPIAPFGETLGELRDDIIYQLAAFTRTALVEYEKKLIPWDAFFEGDSDGKPPEPVA